MIIVEFVFHVCMFPITDGTPRTKTLVGCGAHANLGDTLATKEQIESAWEARAKTHLNCDTDVDICVGDTLEHNQIKSFSAILTDASGPAAPSSLAQLLNSHKSVESFTARLSE